MASISSSTSAPFSWRALATAGLLFSIAVSANAGATTNSRVAATLVTQVPYSSSGVVMNQDWRGSGTVAVNPRIVVSCAHVTYDNNTWLTGNRWNRAWYSSA